MLKENDLLFTMTGTKGKRDYFKTSLVFPNGKNLFLNQRVGCLRPFSDKMNMEYLCLAMKHSCVLDEIFKTETGNVSQGNIGSENTLDLLIPLPPLAEQNRIVKAKKEIYSMIDVLDLGEKELLESINLAKSKILNLAIKGKLVSQDANDEPASELLKRLGISSDNRPYENLPEGWAICELDTIADVLNGYAFKSNNYVEKGIRVIRIMNVQDGYIEDDNPKYYPLDTLSDIQNYLLNDGDLLMSLTGNVGRVGIIDKHFLPAALNQRVACIRTKVEVDKQYLYYVFLSQTFKKDAIDSSKGVAQLNMSTEWLKRYCIPIPPISEQKRIVSKIEELFSQLDFIANTLE